MTSVFPHIQTDGFPRAAQTLLPSGMSLHVGAATAGGSSNAPRQPSYSRAAAVSVPCINPTAGRVRVLPANHFTGAA